MALLYKIFHRLLSLPCVDDDIDDAQRQKLVGAKYPSGMKKLFEVMLVETPRQQRQSAHAGKNSQQDFRKRKLRATLGEQIVAGQRGFETAGTAFALDQGVVVMSRSKPRCSARMKARASSAYCSSALRFAALTHSAKCSRSPPTLNTPSNSDLSTK